VTVSFSFKSVQISVALRLSRHRKRHPEVSRRLLAGVPHGSRPRVAQAGALSKTQCWLLALPQARVEWLRVKNTLGYYAAEFITDVESFMTVSLDQW